VRSAASDPGPIDGRLLIFMKQGSGGKDLAPGEFDSAINSPVVWMAAKEVRNLAPGGTVDVDADEIAYPKPFSAMPSGVYEAQAVLDVDHTYNYSGNSPANWTSDVTAINNWNPTASPEPTLVLTRHPAETMKRKAARLASIAVDRLKIASVRLEQMTSPALSRFWGHPVKISAWVVLPPGYKSGKATYPTVYWTHGFGGGLDSALFHGNRIRERMSDGKMPPMIWVMLDQSTAQGTHEFADSANNGPWGAALTTEFILFLEAKYRMDARPSGRLLNGHSSGGWAALQLQANYPDFFGGAWATSPDSADFHDFSGVDLYAPDANLYRRADGSPTPIIREKGQVLLTLAESAKREQVLGPYGGQWASFEWVFSPKGADGAPRPMFDRETGDVDPEVVAYWRDHYDLARLIEANWPRRGPELKGKFHVTVGTADTFYLDGAVRRFEAVLRHLGGEPRFAYREGRTHFDLYTVGDDPQGLLDQIGAEMYAVARPAAAWKARH
jgi:S-formylglutathione hydrolase FrmB